MLKNQFFCFLISARWFQNSFICAAMCILGLFHDLLHSSYSASIKQKDTNSHYSTARINNLEEIAFTSKCNKKHLTIQVTQILVSYNNFTMKALESLKQFSQLQSLQKTLLSHRIYHQVKGQHSMRIFMESHVFAVWDFMLLLKQLQRKLTCVEKLWVPPVSGSTARFINQIVVGEETDVHPSGHGYTSHFQLYLTAMEEVGANTQPIKTFIKNISEGRPVNTELQNPLIPSHVQQFVSNTISAIQKPTPYVASQFFFGRQDPIPQMFQSFVYTIQSQNNCKVLKYYLQRHIEVDGDDHGPLAQKLMADLAQRQDPRYELIMEGALNAVSNRIKLWDGISQSLDTQAKGEQLSKGKQANSCQKASRHPKPPAKAKQTPCQRTDSIV